MPDNFPETTTTELNDIILRSYVSQTSRAIHVVRFGPGPQGKPSLYKLAGDATAAVNKAFDDGMLVGIPTDTQGLDSAFLLDLTKLEPHVQTWLTARKQRRGRRDVGRAQGDTIGPYDVVFCRKDGGFATGLQKLFVVHCEEDHDKGHQPLAVIEAEEPESVDAMLSLFNAGTYLAFLQQLTIPVGFTCYLLNTDHFWKY